MKKILVLLVLCVWIINGFAQQDFRLLVEPGKPQLAGDGDDFTTLVITARNSEGEVITSMDGKVKIGVSSGFPDETEGALAKRHTALVQQPALALLARGMGLSDAVRLSDGERGAGGADKDAILSDVLEALIGAVFMDAGYMAAHDFVARIYGARIEQDMAPPEDPKSKLQEWAQSRSLPLPVYEVTGQSGPDHAPLFRVSVQVKGFAAQEAEAQSKRAAEKAAAILLLQKIGEKS